MLDVSGNEEVINLFVFCLCHDKEVLPSSLLVDGVYRTYGKFNIHWVALSILSCVYVVFFCISVFSCLKFLIHTTLPRMYVPIKVGSPQMSPQCGTPNRQHLGVWPVVQVENLRDVTYEYHTSGVEVRSEHSNR